MICNFIMKPDMIDNIRAQRYFYNLLKENGNIQIIDQISVNKWSMLAKELYEEESDNKELYNLKIIRTILTYKQIYPIDKAKIVKVSFNSEIISLKQLEEIKKEIRRVFAYAVDAKYYIKILNPQEINFNQKLVDIETDKIKYDIKCYDRLIEDDIYKFAYLNMIHFSDPDELSIEIDNNKILKYLMGNK